MRPQSSCCSGVATIGTHPLPPEPEQSMSGYWGRRHAEALAKAEKAATPALRAVYRQLADHYRSLDQAAQGCTDEDTQA